MTKVLFIPYAMTKSDAHDDYTEKVRKPLMDFGFEVEGKNFCFKNDSFITLESFQAFIRAMTQLKLSIQLKLSLLEAEILSCF